MWCEACRDRFDRDHWVVPWIDPDGAIYQGRGHGVGAEFGPYGRLLAIEQAAQELVQRPSDPQLLADLERAVGAEAL